MMINKAEFISSSPSRNECPKGSLPEFAFIGRSNVGKSSLINMITGNTKLAHTSSKPGKTQLINHFLINDLWYLVDLPGYGFAKQSKKLRADWEQMIRDFLQNRENLSLTFVLLDARHAPLEGDIDFIHWLGEKNIPFVLVFTKTDKVSETRLGENLASYKGLLAEVFDALPFSVLSSTITGHGREQILAVIDDVRKGGTD